MPITVDISSVKPEFEPVPFGIYEAELSDITDVPAGERGNEKPYTTLTFTIIEGQYGGQKLFSNAPWILTQFLTVIGKPPVKGPDGLYTTVDVNEEDVLMRPCRLRVIQKTYEGKLKNEIKAVMKYDSSSGNGNAGGQELKI